MMCAITRLLESLDKRETNMYHEITNGSPLAGAATIEQLNEIVQSKRAYPEASCSEIAELLGYREAVIQSVVAYYFEGK